jgi:hypothetical protein
MQNNMQLKWPKHQNNKFFNNASFLGFQHLKGCREKMLITFTIFFWMWVITLVVTLGWGRGAKNDFFLGIYVPKWTSSVGQLFPPFFV